MGNVKSQLDPEDVEDYAALTYLTHRQIYTLFERYKDVDRQAVERDKDARLPIEALLGAARVLPELQCNPFRDRLLKVFSSEDDGRLSFEDFLDLASALSEHADEKLKSAYAFQIFDFDEDGLIGHSDVEQMVKRLVGSGVPDSLTDESSTTRRVEHAAADNGGFRSEPPTVGGEDDGGDGVDFRTDARSVPHRRASDDAEEGTRSADDMSSLRGATAGGDGSRQQMNQGSRAQRITDRSDDAPCAASTSGPSRRRRRQQRTKSKSETAASGSLSLLSEAQLRKVVDSVMEEADLGKSGGISLPEFVHLASKVPDFASAFTIRF